MNTMVLLGNFIAFIGCLLMVGIGFIRKKERILMVQCLQFGALGAANLVLGGYSGAISSLVSIIRNLVFAKRTVTPGLKIGFILFQLLLSAKALLTGPLEWLPFLSVAVFTWFLDVKSEVSLKLLIIVTCTPWVVYDFCHLNFVAMTFDVLTILSNFIGILMVRKTTKSN